MNEVSRNSSKGETSRRDFLAIVGSVGAASFCQPLLELAVGAGAEIPSGLNIQDPFGLPDDPAGAFRPFAVRAGLLISQLVQGLNYLGQPSDFVSRYEVQAFVADLNQLFALSDTAEKARIDFRSKRKIAQDRDKAFDDQIHASIQLQTAHETEISLIDKSIIPSTAKAVDALNSEIDKQHAVVMQSEQDFNDACLRFSQGSGCHLTEVLQGVAAFIGVVAAVYTGGASLVATIGSGLGAVREAASALSTAKDVSTFVNDIRKDYKSIVTIVDQVDSDWAKVQSAYNTYKSVLVGTQSTFKILTDATGLRGQLDRFDSEIEHSPASDKDKADFKREVHTFYDLVQTRNNKLLEIDSLVLREKGLLDQVDLRKAEQLDLRHLKSLNADPDAETYLRILDRMSGALLEQMRTLVWQEARSLWLWTLQPPPGTANLEGTTFDELNLAHTLIYAQFVDREAAMPGNSETFGIHSHTQIVVPFVLRGGAALTLKRDGKVALNVTKDSGAFPHTWYAIYVTRVQVRVDGITDFIATITHPGRGTFDVGQEGSPSQMFSMCPRTSTATNHSTADLGAQDGKYVGLSPFTQWLLSFNDHQNLGLDKVTKIELIFEGRNRTRQ